MGQDYSSWFYQQHSSRYSPELNCASIPPDVGQENTQPMTIPANMASASRAMPDFAFTELPPLKSVIANEPKIWGYRNANQNFAQVTKLLARERFPSSPFVETLPNSGATTVEKRLLVFDQTGNRTSLIFSSFCPLQYPSSMKPKQVYPTGFCVGLPMSKEPASLDPLKAVSWCGGSDETDVVLGGHGSEMHEDTEEIDALLCSDDEEEDDDDEVTSTGHSPLDMAGYEIKEEVNDSAQVTNPVTPTKRRRPDEETDMALMDTASSGEPFRDYEDDAELSCIKGNLQAESTSSSCKRLRKEKIRETVGVLRSIIPGGKGKDAAMVLDEAIRYLRTLRLKAKAMGAVSSLK